jgi:hypothetical protein
MRIFLAVLVSLLIAPALSAHAEVEQYRAIQRLSLSLLELCPPADCVLVFSGRSGTPIAAYIEALIREPTLSVPLSSFRFNPLGDTGHTGRRRLYPEEEDELFEHFDRFIAAERVKGKQVLTIDFASSGRSQAAFTAYLNRWIRKRGLTEDARAVPLADSTSFEKVEAAAAEYGVQIEKKAALGRSFFNALNEQTYDEVSPYGSYEMFHDGIPSAPPPTRPQKKYRILVEEISDLQSQSTEVAKFKAGNWKSESGAAKKLRALLSSLCAGLFDVETLY